VRDGEDGTIEVQGDACNSAEAQPLQEQFAAETAQILHAAFIGGSQDAADGGDIGQHVESEQTFDERVVFVEADVAEAAIAGQHMDDEQQHDTSVGEDGRAPQVLKAGIQALQELEVLEELPEEDQTSKGCEALVFEGKGGHRSVVAQNGACTIFHVETASLFLSLPYLTYSNIRKQAPSRFTKLQRISNITGRDVGAQAPNGDSPEQASISYESDLCNTGVDCPLLEGTRHPCRRTKDRDREK
jgi:hypothetical protein